MCEICHQSPCHPRCPNHEEVAVYTCKACGEAIVEGDDYYEMDGEFWHEDCFEDCAVQLLLDECGAMKGVAQREDRDD